MDDLWYPEIGESQKTKVYKELMKLNRNSTEFINNKQEFNAYQNVLRRLINQSENMYYSTQFENNKGDGRKTWRTMNNLLHRKSSKSIPDAIILKINYLQIKVKLPTHLINNDNDNECFILTYQLIKLIICNTMINLYSHSQGNYIMTYISLACNYRNSLLLYA